MTNNYLAKKYNALKSKPMKTFVENDLECGNVSNAVTILAHFVMHGVEAD